ncbi:PepSY domain-containing protein [Microvirga thermotolerans]|nr:PepSY domain-containing protein [Microvirga thermotolerans]
MRLLPAVAAAALLSQTALAQTPSPPASGPDLSNPAVNLAPKGSPERAGTVAPGANSFTEGQARSRIEAQGFSDVSDLRKDDQGIWHAKANRDGRSVEVLLDYRGNVASK